MSEDRNIEKHKVLFAEYLTGNVYTTELKLFIGQGEIYKYFDTYAEALEYANAILIKRSDLEFTMADPNNKLLIFKNALEEKLYQN